MTNLATSYVLLAPWNFNDHDPSIESRNSVLLNGKGQWVIEEAVAPAQCVPSMPRDLEYHGVVGWREDGMEIASEGVELDAMVGKPWFCFRLMSIALADGRAESVGNGLRGWHDGF